MVQPPKNKKWIWPVLVLLVIGIYMAVSYNGFVQKEEDVSKYWSELQATYQRRTDLLPSLVSVVKANSEYEKTVFADIASARSNAQQAMASHQQPDSAGYNAIEGSQGDLANSANRLIAIIEKYPELKATKAFSDLQTQIEGTERRVSYARKDFNNAVAGYNAAVRAFPAKLVAGIMGFKPKDGFRADANAQTAPVVNFSK